MTIYVVDSLSDAASGVADGQLTLREAITAANTDAAFGDAAAGTGFDTITFANGLSGTLTLTQGTLQISDALRILGDTNGDGASDITVDGGGPSILIGTRIFEISATTTIDALDMANGAANGNGGAILHAAGELTVENLAMTANVAAGFMGASGGHIASTGTSVTATNVTFTDGQAGRAGGAIELAEGADLSITDSTFTGNSAVGGPAGPGNGGAIHATAGGDGSTVEITTSEFTGNTAAAEGGALWNAADGTMIVSDTDILENEARGDAADQGGGGIFNDGGTLSVRGSDLSFNLADGTSGSGGAILSVDGTVTVDDTFVELNSANRAGGGIEIIEGALLVGGASSLFGNDVSGFGTGGAPNPGNGGAVHVTGAANVTIGGSTLVSGNEAAAEGGGLWNSATGTMVVAGSDVFIGNNTALGDAADQGGGGIFNDGGTLTVTGAEITGNAAIGTSGSGGGILSIGGTVDVTGASILGNEASRAGGGIEIVTGTVTIDTTTLGSNVAGDGGVSVANPGNGGGLHVTGMGADITVSDSTVTGNVATAEGGGLWNAAGSTLTVDNTTVAGNVASGTAADQGGGGIFNDGGTLLVSDSAITGNSADAGLGSGGGILSVDGLVAIANSRIDENDANRAGGGIEIIDGTLLTRLVDFVFNTADGDGGPGNGGAVHVSGTATTTFAGSNILDNTAAAEGGGLWNQSGATMDVFGSNLANNVAQGDDATQGGGAIFNNGGTLSVRSSSLDANLATGTSGSGGGILAVGGSDVTVADTTFGGNGASRAGGGIEMTTATAMGTAAVTLDVDLSAFVGNNTGAAPGNGGGIHLSGNGQAGSTVTVDNSLFEGNTAASEGGGFWNDQGFTSTVTATAFTNNTAAGDAADNGGGGVFNNGGVLRLIESNLTANSATGTSGSGGGLLSVGGILGVLGTTFEDNTAQRAGGGVEIAGGASNTFVQNNFLGNVTEANPGNGGGVHVGGTGTRVSFTDDLFDDNRAANEGGGLWISGGTLATVDDVTFTENVAASEGGGIYVVDGGALRVDDSILVGNEAPSGQAIGSGVAAGPQTGGIVVSDSIIAGDSIQGSGSRDMLEGDSGANTLFGNGGNDILTGRGGADTLDGGAQNDILLGGDGADALIGGAGFDFASYADAAAGVTASLATPATNTGDAAGDTYDGIEGLVGSGDADALEGDAAANLLLGRAGNDAIAGAGGDDTIVGGFGQDVMTGGSGADVFLYNSFFEARVRGRDTITDFERGTDVIDLSRIDADTTAAGDQAFTFIGNGATFTGTAGELTFFRGSVQGDVNGDGAADVVIGLDGVFQLTADDFVL